MRFRDYILNKAIKYNYLDLVKNKTDLSLLDMLYITIAKKFNIKMIVSESEAVAIPVKNKDWQTLLTRYAYYDKELKINRRYLEYDMVEKRSIYFSEEGILYSGNGSVFKIILNEKNDETLYSKHKEFLDFVKEYFKVKRTSVINYLIIGYTDLKTYYISNKGALFKAEPDGSNLQEITENDVEDIDICKKMINDLCN